MSEVNSLKELTAQLAVGDKILWIGSHSVDSAGDYSQPNTVTSIERNEEKIRVDGEGVRGGKYHFTIEDGESRAYHHDSNESEPTYKGEVAVARITNSDAPVPVKRVFDDLRSKSKSNI